MFRFSNKAVEEGNAPDVSSFFRELWVLIRRENMCKKPSIKHSRGLQFNLYSFTKFTEGHFLVRSHVVVF